MPANTNPIFSREGLLSGCNIFLQNTRSDGGGTIGTDLWKVCEASPTGNGSYISRVRFNPVSVTAAVATSATVLRLYTSSNSANGSICSGHNTRLFQEQACAAQTADQTTTATFFFEIPCDFVLPPSGSILASTHVANATTTCWQAQAYGGNY